MVKQGKVVENLEKDILSFMDNKLQRREMARELARIKRKAFLSGEQAEKEKPEKEEEKVEEDGSDERSEEKERLRDYIIGNIQYRSIKNLKKVEGLGEIKREEITIPSGINASIARRMKAEFEIKRHH